LSHVLLTGATGLVGRYLLKDLLLADQPIAVLVRAKCQQSAAERLDRLLTFWEGQLKRRLPRPTCLEGDIARADLGLSRDSCRWITDHCHSVFHSAASLQFFGTNRDGEPWRTNLAGTANVLEFCRQFGIREMHHVSTAFVCGRRTGLIREDELEMGQDFRNDYEHAKFKAEVLVRQARFLDRLTIYRPGIITGDSRTGYTSTYHGFYAYIQFGWLAVQMLARGHDGRVFYPIRITLTGDERRNLVPVDWVSEAASRIFLNRALHGKTYHLTPRIPLRARQAQEALVEYFQIRGPIFIGQRELIHAEMNDFERMFYDYMARYKDYWSAQPLFDCTNTMDALPDLPCPELDAACLRRLIDFAVRNRFGKKREPRQKKPITRCDPRTTRDLIGMQ
jgi:nucleoside-diphosphate-sugar epimerase